VLTVLDDPRLVAPSLCSVDRLNTKFRTPDLGGNWLIPVSVFGVADQGVRKG
jgi:hypothetical protein